tara:strand:- start:60 stop:524 length:465 start_codon:yes stop_codon:yes gene_type:complete
MKSLLIFSILIISCNRVTAPNDYQVSKEYYESGELKRIITHNNDNMTAEMTVYYKDGALMGRASMIHEKLNGKAFGYHQNGNIAMVCNFVEDSFHGYAALYYDSKIIKYEGSYNMGIIDGEWTAYMPDGDILREYIYNNGELLEVKGDRHAMEE